MTEHVANIDARESRRTAEEAREQTWRHPSFGRQLFLGDFSPDLLRRTTDRSDAMEEREDAFLRELATFLSEHVDPARIEDEARLPTDVIDGLRALGAFGMKIPRAYGGLGMSIVGYCRALALAASAAQPLYVLLSGHQSIGVPQPVLMFGTEDQKQRFLPRCARGEISAFLLTEPDAGSDPARLAMTALPTEDDSAYVLRGTKLWATNAPIADLLVVVARVPRSRGRRGGITAFIVEANTPGITNARRLEFMGLRGIENGLVTFDDVRVPAENRVGAEGMGLKIALTTLNTGRLAIPAACAAAVKWCLKTARQWAAERVQWGQPIGRHEAVAHKLAYIAGAAFAVEAVAETTAALADDGNRDIRIEAAIAKMWASEVAWRVADETLQIRGGRGYETARSLASRGEAPVPLEQLLRDLRINRVFEGSTEIMSLAIAREAVDVHLKVAGQIIDPEVALRDRVRVIFARAVPFYAGWLPTLVAGAGYSPRSYPEFGRLATHLRFAERSSRKLARSMFYAMVRHRGGLEQRQALLFRAVEIGSELFAMTASCLHAQQRVTGDPAAGAKPVDLADVFCRGSRRRVRTLFARMFDANDVHQYRAALRVLEGEHTWLEPDLIDVVDLLTRSMPPQAVPEHRAPG